MTAPNAPADRTRGEGLTTPQRDLLGSICRRGRDRVVRGYKPAAKLRDLGLADIEDVGHPYAWRVTPTEAGRRALADAEMRREP